MKTILSQISFFVFFTALIAASGSVWTACCAEIDDSASTPVQTVWLDELDVSNTLCGWLTPQSNRSIDGNPLSIGGRKYDRGIGNHAPGEIAIHFKDSRSAIRFSALVGINDEENATGPAEFKVYSNKTLLYQSGPMVKGDAAKSIDLPLEGVIVLRLVSDKCEAYHGDHTSWVNAKIEFRGENSQAIALYTHTPTDDSGTPLNITDELSCEWFDLDRQVREGMKPNVVAETFNPAATILESDRDPLDIVLRRLVPLIDELKSQADGPTLTDESAALAKLTDAAKSVAVDQVDSRKKLFAEAVDLRRRIALQNPLLASFRDLFFIKRHPCHQAENRGNHMCDQFFGFNALPGGGVFVLQNAFSDSPKLVNVLENVPQLSDRFGYLSPELSYDNREILFAATNADLPRSTFTWTDDNCFHIFKAKFNPQTGLASDLVQLTEGAYNDFDPCYLPSGRIAFISERRGGYGRCHPRIVPTYTLYSMEPDGTDITMLSAHETNEWQPDVDHNGMIIYTRWDYVDRGANNAHHPWITTPDGRDPRALHGNYSESAYNRPLFEADIHAVPGSTKITAIACAHHGQNFGSLILADPQVRDDNKMGPIRRITPDQLFPESELPNHAAPARYGTCRPLSEKFYIVAYDAFGRGDHGSSNNYGIYLLDCFGNRVLIYRDPKISCCDAQPLRPRARQPIVPHKTLVGVPGTRPGQAVPKSELPKTANIGLINVYDTMLPFPTNADGSALKISRLRIVQLLPKTTPYESQPAIGYGHQKGARRVLGTVPVEPDGSAYFQVPVNIPIYFQALDENGVAVQSMRSDTYVHEGEELVCQGCHEDRHSSMRNRPAGTPKAFRRAPSAIAPDPDGTDPINYALLIQPILDAKCVECHAKNADNPKSIDLSRGPDGKHFFNSFENLKPYCFYYNHYLWTDPQTLPGQFGSRASKLWTILQSDHYGLKLTPEEKYRFNVWLDNNCDFYGTYENCDVQRAGKPVPIILE